MYQQVQGIWMEIVDFDTLPELPIYGLTEQEATYATFLSKARGFIHRIFDPSWTQNGRCAEALTHAIETGVISGPGKYGIHFTSTNDYQIYKITD